MKQKKIIIAAMLAFIGLSSSNATVITINNNSNTTNFQAVIDIVSSDDTTVITKSKELGLVSYLTTVKSYSEFKMISFASNEGHKSQSDLAKQFKSEYNLLKLDVDKLINQLSADLIVNNKPKKYKKINKYVKNDNSNLPKSLLPYKNLIIEIDKKLEKFILKKYFIKKDTGTNEINKAMEGSVEAEVVIEIAELIHGIVTDARDFREKKVANIVSLLGNLKLQSLKDLTETKEKEKENQKQKK